MEAMRKVEVLRAACCVAGVDGATSDAERRVLQRLADEVGVGEASLRAMIERAEEDRSFFEQQFKVLKAEPKATMQLLFRVAVADGDLKRSEATVLKGLATRLDVTPEQFDSWLKQAIEFLRAKRASEPG